MSNTKTEAQCLADALYELGNYVEPEKIVEEAAAELRRLDAIEQRYNEMMANPCPEWDGKAYIQAIANLRAQLDQTVAEEREACALAAEAERLTDGINEPTDVAYNNAVKHCAAAIRARSNT